MKSVLMPAGIAGSYLSLSDAKSLWSRSPATYGPDDSDSYILKTGYPVGNGKLGIISFGQPASEKLSLNVDSLWSGGPFENSSYAGGNPTEPKYAALQEIRAAIFQNGTGDLAPLLGTGMNYGSNRVLGNVTITIPGIESYDNYKRSLDLKTGIHATQFTSNEANFTTALFCSYPDHVCVYHIESTSALPDITVSFENMLTSQDLVTTTCSADSVQLTGYTRAGSPQSMKYSAIARALGNATMSSCSDFGSLIIRSAETQKSQTFVIAADTNYDQKKGTKEASYSFRGEDPVPVVSKIASQAVSKEYKTLLARHLQDYQQLEGAFSLELPDPNNSSKLETAVVFSNYDWTGSGDPFLESLLFDYSRHLLISSSRDNSLPANLQGRWTERLESAWGADYHANINLQMNYWAAEQTGLGDTEGALWDYMEDTWVPRGTETARLLYNASGWVVHNEMNIFGHTAMKEDALWANYPAAAAWMMQHVWDHFDYTQDVNWLRNQGYPLLKGVAQFWVSQLQEDLFFNDGTLVVNPCNSPETGPTTFGYTHYQQLIHQVFDNVLSSAAIIGEEDKGFLDSVSSSLARLDTGVHFTSWGGIKEWKMPDSYGYDGKSTHRHLSHLVGWYPGYSVSSYTGGYSNSTIQDAVRETLIARGLGNGADANAGWEKVWRAACWARLNDTDMAYKELRYAIDTNFANNGFSMYNAQNQPFQIDANFGLAGAVLSMLVVDLPVAYGAQKERTVVLGPAIPAAWGHGSLSGLRIRGGVFVDFKWDGDGLVTSATPTASARTSGRIVIVFVNVRGDRLARI
ncbi:Six-hairpin glycosidase-like protein [Xylaria bambusicola]|uniref:Six-hairpin glycosidase-like protein n=1 Tax=Xylaria bambusicola TaxID=326684 RepID=UPI002007DDC6|nr:Six-hairpin glycosidase-like protein [Xylaria bambusicola]KAI0514338.1 Six-hairpin glycosidase-like protein [Xylaria bambusicola]